MSAFDRGTNGWPPLRYVWTAALGVIAIYHALQFLFDVRAVLVILFFGVLFALVLAYPVNFLSRGMPRWAAVLVVLWVILAFDATVVYLGVPFAERQVQWASENLPKALDRLNTWMQQIGATGEDSPLFGRSLQQRIRTELGNVLQKAVPVAFNIVSAVSGAIAVLALALFLAYDPPAYRRGLLHFVPREREDTVSDLLQELGTMMQRWMVGTLASMTLTGVLIAIGLAIVGIESWLVLGVLSFVLEFIPYLGPALAAIPGIAIGFAVSPQMALWVAAVYGVVQLVESYLLQPLIMKQAIRIQPALLLVWQLALGAVFGLLGLFAATPLLACLYVVTHYFHRRRHPQAA